MKIARAAILGFGTVGQGIFKIATESREELSQRLGIQLEIVAVLVQDLYRPDRTLPPFFNTNLLTDNISDVLHGNIDVIFEAMVGEEPAYTYARTAIDALHIIYITANKALFAKHGLELQRLAAEDREKRARIGYEATVCSGTPVVKVLQSISLAQRVNKIEGILNGTTNYVLSSMRLHPERTFEDAVRDAQARGYAEADPTNDLSGQDAYNKLLVLAGIAYRSQAPLASSRAIGIDTITPELVRQANASGLRYRHVACLTRVGAANAGGVASFTATVEPRLLDAQHPFFLVDGVDNIVMLHTNYAGTITLRGPGAGMYPTASAMIEDYAVLISSRPAM